MDDATATMIANLPDRTGRSLGEWLTILSPLGLDRHGQIVAYLKGEHGMTHGYANLVAHCHIAGDRPAASGAELIDAQYHGAKAALRPICDRLIEVAAALGDDVEVATKKTSVSLRRSKQFALIVAATRSRIDLGLNLPGEPATGRLSATSGMCTHTVAIVELADIDDELFALLRAAYERA